MDKVHCLSLAEKIKMPIFYPRNLMIAVVTVAAVAVVDAAAVTAELSICGDSESRALGNLKLKI